MMLGDTPLLILATVEDARRQLPGHDEDDILALIEEGRIDHAWNIAVHLDTAREIRIWPDSITRALQPSTCNLQPVRSPVESIMHIATGDKPFARGKILALVFNCSRSHIINLVEARQLAMQPGTSYERGPNGTPLITLSSLKHFLTSRRII